MMRRASSLSLRLSLSLAVLAFVGLGTVCALVYASIADGLDQRQTTELEETGALIRHLVSEAEPSQDIEGLIQTLSDVDRGYAGILIRIVEPGGGTVFISPNWAPVRASYQRPMWLTAPWRHLPEERLVIFLRLDTRADDQLLTSLRTTLLAGALLGAAAIALLSRILVRRGLAPVAELAAQLKAIRPGDGRVHIDVGARHLELREFVERFNVLLAEVDAAYAQLAAFNADVAHELRTPLAELIADSEVMLSRLRSVDEWREAGGRHLEDLRRLASIVADMLFLARADAGQTTRLQPVRSLAALVSEVVDYHEAAYEEAQLTVRVVGDAAGRFDPQLLKRVVSNLLSNAARFARPGTEVEIQIARAGDTVRLVAGNLGPDIPAEHLPHLFQRFWRIGATRSEETTHHGLGLAIVAAVARVHGGQPFARSAQGRTEIGVELRDPQTEAEPSDERRAANAMNQSMA